MPLYAPEATISAWRDVPLRPYAMPFGGSVAAATYLLGAAAAKSVNVASNADCAFYLDPADYPSGSRTLQLRMRTFFMTDSTAPGVNFTLALNTPTFGTVTNTSSITAVSAAVLSVSKTAPGASTQFHDETSPIAFPAAGWFCFTVANSGTTAANSSSFFSFNLQHRAL